MKDVFLSYVRADRYFAKEVRNWLEQADISVWQDIKDIRPGDQWEQKIDEAISASRLVLVVLSPAAVKSQYVTYEWAFALGQHKSVVPLIHNNCDMHSKLQSLQHLDCQEDDEHVKKQIIAEVRNRLKESKKDAAEYMKNRSAAVVREGNLDGFSKVPASLDINGWHINAPIFPDVAKGDYGHDQYGYWFALNYKGIRQVFRWIPLGRMRLGSPVDEEGRWDDGRESLYQIHFQDGFWMADFPVTQLQYNVITGESPSLFKQEDAKDLPVESVSWRDADRYLQQLNKQVPGLDARLPLECEWEYACRAGTTTAFWFGDSIDSSQVNFGKNLSKTNAYQAFPANPWGLYDMHGNVWEWCLDPWQEAQASGIRSLHPHQESQAVYKQAIALLQQDESQCFSVRGGGWYYDGQNCRSAYRSRFVADDRDADLGFRLVRSPEL